MILSGSPEPCTEARRPESLHRQHRQRSCRSVLRLPETHWKSCSADCLPRLSQRSWTPSLHQNLHRIPLPGSQCLLCLSRSRPRLQPLRSLTASPALRYAARCLSARLLLHRTQRSRISRPALLPLWFSGRFPVCGWSLSPVTHLHTFLNLHRLNVFLSICHVAHFLPFYVAGNCWQQNKIPSNHYCVLSAPVLYF